MLRARWREDEARQSLDWWMDYFQTVRASDFLMGRTDGPRGPFNNCDLEWLVRPNNFAKVIEGKFSDHKMDTDEDKEFAKTRREMSEWRKRQAEKEANKPNQPNA